MTSSEPITKIYRITFTSFNTKSQTFYNVCFKAISYEIIQQALISFVDIKTGIAKQLPIDKCEITVEDLLAPNKDGGNE